jgi:hypothetical protein
MTVSLPPNSARWSGLVYPSTLPLYYFGFASPNNSAASARV